MVVEDELQPPFLSKGIVQVHGAAARHHEHPLHPKIRDLAGHVIRQLHACPCSLAASFDYSTGLLFFPEAALPIDELDIREILSGMEGSRNEFRASRLFITGGTGFFGKWVLESFVAMNSALGLGASATVLSRDPETFLAREPHLAAERSLAFLKGDVRSFGFPEGRFTHVLHLATESSVFVDAREPLPRLEAMIDGMRRILAFTAESGAHSFLLTSTGGIYGKQPPEVLRVPEDFPGSPSPTASSSSMGEGKRVSELMACLHAEKFGFSAKIARCFAFSGPHLPLDSHYAFGNFIGDCLARRPVRVRGDGSPVRSYLYASDLTVWLWTILARGAPGEAYNVGSEDPVSILELAKTIASHSEEPLPVIVEKPALGGGPPERYVPSTAKARGQLGVGASVSLNEGIRRTLKWHRNRLDLAS